MWWIGAAIAGPGASPDPAALARDWEAHRAALAAHARLRTSLGTRDFDRLAAGEVVRTRVKEEGADRAVGAAWTDRPRDALWVAILDDRHDQLVSGLVEEQLPGTGPERKLLYQRLDLPWPIADRQWVIEIANNRGLWEATGGAAWERTWRLSDSGLAPHPDADAVWMPANEGGWQLVDLGGGTLLVYEVRVQVGGAIPDEAATRWALATLDGMLRHVIARADVVPSHYRAGHEPLVRPDGSAVPGW